MTIKTQSSLIKVRITQLFLPKAVIIQLLLPNWAQAVSLAPKCLELQLHLLKTVLKQQPCLLKDGLIHQLFLKIVLIQELLFKNSAQPAHTLKNESKN